MAKTLGGALEALKATGASSSFEGLETFFDFKVVRTLPCARCSGKGGADSAKQGIISNKAAKALVIKTFKIKNERVEVVHLI